MCLDMGENYLLIWILGSKIKTVGLLFVKPYVIQLKVPSWPLWDKVSTGALKSYQSNHKSLQMFALLELEPPKHGSVWSNVLRLKGNCTFLLELSYFVKTFTPYQVNGLTYDLFTKTLTPSRASGLTFWPPRAHQCCLTFDSDSWPNLSV